MSKHSLIPKHGYTKDGHPIHGRVIDHHKDETKYQRFNRKIAIWITENVGTMTCFWFVFGICMLVLPSVLFAMGAIHIVAFFTTFGFELFITWAISTTFQAVMLPALLVGQNLQNSASDARAAKQFEDLEWVRDQIDLTTEGGLNILMDKLEQLERDLTP